MNTWKYPPCLQAFGWNVIVWARVRPLKASWASLESHSLLIILLTVFVASVNRYFQQYNLPCHKALIISGWLQEHDSGFNLHQPPTPSADLKPTELWQEAERRAWQWGGMAGDKQLLFQSISWHICASLTMSERFGHHSVAHVQCAHLVILTRDCKQLWNMQLNRPHSTSCFNYLSSCEMFEM